MIPAAIERNYPKRLLTAGWWYMSLFQQPASGKELGKLLVEGFKILPNLEQRILIGRVQEG